MNVFVQHVESFGDSLDCVGSGNGLMKRETKQTFSVSCSHVLFGLELTRLVIDTGRLGMTFVAWIIAVCFVRLETDAVVSPETDRYSKYLESLSY